MNKRKLLILFALIVNVIVIILSAHYQEQLEPFTSFIGIFLISSCCILFLTLIAKSRLEQRLGVEYWDYQKQQPATAKEYSKLQDEQALQAKDRAKLAKLDAELEAMHTAFVTYWGGDPEMWKRNERWDGTKRPDPPISPAKRWLLIKRFKRLNKLRDKIISKETQ